MEDDQSSALLQCGNRTRLGRPRRRPNPRFYTSLLQIPAAAAEVGLALQAVARLGTQRLLQVVAALFALAWRRCRRIGPVRPHRSANCQSGLPLEPY